MERLIDQFHAIVREFRLKRHDLLDYHNNKFDRDYVEFNVKVSHLLLLPFFFLSLATFLTLMNPNKHLNNIIPNPYYPYPLTIYD
jgi:hypothetical protein